MHNTESANNYVAHLWNQAGVHDIGGAVAAQIIHHYTEPHRFYHTLQHILFMLSEFETVREISRNPLALELAILYHDIVYLPESTKNEEGSAEVFSIHAEALNLNPQLVGETKKLILATKFHSPYDEDSALLIDLDLLILGQSEKTFDEYEVNIRREYAHESDYLRSVKRIGVLEKFLARPRIYNTQYFHEQYEDAARNNLTRSIAKLKGTENAME
jgi:predicted metal-dependent HD superfamily phosphohydrolase